ncbi:MAG: hypothetical protein M1829_003849 [Trizodia sp. TS-e1964]|nr:MAG: hypothetical protein M1829_003849 [Trizodia sp. TS-e1964]
MKFFPPTRYLFSLLLLLCLQGLSLANLLSTLDVKCSGRIFVKFSTPGDPNDGCITCKGLHHRGAIPPADDPASICGDFVVGSLPIYPDRLVIAMLNYNGDGVAYCDLVDAQFQCAQTGIPRESYFFLRNDKYLVDRSRKMGQVFQFASGAAWGVESEIHYDSHVGNVGLRCERMALPV